MTDNITKESKHKGIPVTDVASAQEALLGLMETPKEQTSETEEVTETQDVVSEQAMENAESVETEVEDSEISKVSEISNEISYSDPSLIENTSTLPGLK